MLEKINLAIVIVNYNSARDTLACIKSIENSETSYTYKIIVVDNYSSDDSVLLLEKNKGDFEFVVSKVNNGYCAGNNLGIQYAEKKYDFDYIWVLNPDTEIKNDAIQNIVTFAYAHKECGLIGALLLYDFDRNTIQALGGGKIGFSKKMNFQILNPYFHNEAFSEKDAIMPDSIECKSIIGAALLIKKEVCNEVGYFDASYFLYSDETEFCIRVLKQTKYKLVALKNVVVFHKEGSRQEKRKFITQYYLTRNWLYNVKKYYPLLLPYVMVYHIVYLFKLKCKKQTELLYYTKYALLDFVRNKKGKYTHTVI